MQIEPTNGALGADAIDIDLSKELSKNEFTLILDAWHKYSVLRFRKQNLDDKHLVNFSKQFGPLDMAPTGRGGTPFDPKQPEIAVISNIVINGKKTGSLGNSELVWHQDMSYVETPPKASILYGIEVPRTTGNTSFYNLYDAYASLPADLKSKISDLSCKHDATRNSAGQLRVGYSESYCNEERPGAIHPLVIRHPETNRTALYLGRRPNAWIPGLLPHESDTLLNTLWHHIDTHNFTWTQEWEKGDLIIWDNRCTFHRRGQLDPSERRLMHRTQISTGQPPVAAFT